CRLTRWAAPPRCRAAAAGWRAGRTGPSPPSWLSPTGRTAPAAPPGAVWFFFSSRRRHTRSVSAFLLNRSSDLWIATDRSRARRCVEACVYGTLDFVGYPRFPAPVEFIAAVIAYYVHPVNIQTACLIMEGAEFTENII